MPGKILFWWFIALIVSLVLGCGITYLKVTNSNREPLGMGLRDWIFVVVNSIVVLFAIIAILIMKFLDRN